MFFFYLKVSDFCISLFLSGESTEIFTLWGGVGALGGGLFNLIEPWFLLLLSFHCNINCTSFEYSPHFIKIYNNKQNKYLSIKNLNNLLTFSGFSVGASCLSLFLHLSISVNRPDLPVACANAYTTSYNNTKK